MSTTAQYEKEAYELGVEHAKNTASWVTDGNQPTGHAERVLAMMENGDPESYDYLPRAPDLSGEWADSPTPSSLYRTITGRDESTGNALSFETEHGWLMDKLCDAYELGVSDTFHIECERILREALA